MQKAGKGPRMETGAGIPKEFMGPAMHEPRARKKPDIPQNIFAKNKSGE